MSNERSKLPEKTEKAADEVTNFLHKLATTPAPRPRRARLMFALDATASRQPTWDRACHIQTEMFKETATLGGLDIQLVFFRGDSECRATGWLNDSHELARRMSKVTCLGGYTQIAKLLRHALAQTKQHKVNALVFVGDAMEENVDELASLAGELGRSGVPVFVFHEGDDTKAAQAFQQIARRSNGAYCRFDADSAQQLRELLSAVAVFAAGGRSALEDYGHRTGGAVLQITRQLGKP